MNFISRYNNIIIKYSACGILFGFLFPLLGLTFDFYRLDFSFSIENLFQIQQENPIHFIIYSAPFILGFMGYKIGSNQKRFLKSEKDKLKSDQRRIQGERELEFKNKFIASMSHEIRTPMNGVIGMLDLLEHNTKLDGLQMEYLQTIKDSSQSLMTVINDILDLSKLEAGLMEIYPVPSNVEKIVTHVLQLFENKAAERMNQLNFTIDADVPNFLLMDKVRVIQILSNFMSNAIKFTSKGQISIHVSLKQNERENLLIRFAVKDTGNGIPENEVDKLFGEYSQLESTKNENHNGTGLGLNISKMLTRIMGGTVGVDSVEGEGSTFWFIILTEKAESNYVNIEEKKLKEEFNLRILMAEDQQVNSMIASMMLSNIGCMVTVATNGRKAVDQFERDKYDLIFMDIEMPEMNGIEATKELIKLHEGYLPPIIALTANAVEGLTDKYTEVGMTDVLYKPITTKTVLKMLNKWF